MNDGKARSVAVDVATWVIPALIYTILCSRSLPVLRHDWTLPPTDILATAGTMSGWYSGGIGTPVPYPASFLLIDALAIVGQGFGAYNAHLVLCFLTGATVAFGASAVSMSAGLAKPLGRAALALIALFNPWFYTKLAAGHTLMLLSIGGCLIAASELMRCRTRPWVLVLALLAIAPQIQFFALASALMVVGAFRARSVVPFLAFSWLALPSALGVLMERSAFDQIPLTLNWENDQSVLPASALILTGYFARYSTAFDGYVAPAAYLMVLIAVVGMFRARARHAAWLASVAAILALVVAMGLDGPLAQPLAYAFEHLKAMLLFRELFDLLGVVLVAYIVLQSIAASRWPVLRWGLLGVGLWFLCGWIAWSPLRFAVDARLLPPAPQIGDSARERYALMPGFQPMSYEGEGSGLDPDIRTSPVDSAVNTMNANAYPMSSAIGLFMESRNPELLQNLGVSKIYAREGYASSTDALSGQWALPVSSFSPFTRYVKTLTAAQPLASLLPGPPRVIIDPRHLWGGDILASDARTTVGSGLPSAWKNLPAAESIVAPPAEHEASKGWVDARLSFAQRPELGQPYGGAVTTSPTERLEVDGPTTLLVFLEGTLISNQEHILNKLRGWQLIRISATVHDVRCRGLCLVAAQGQFPTVAFEHSRRSGDALSLRCEISWLCSVVTPAHRLDTLRVLTAYDPTWVAIGPMTGGVLSHFRIDGEFNGWLIGNAATSQTVFIVECASLAIAMAELGCVIFLVRYFILQLLAWKRLSALRQGG